MPNAQIAILADGPLAEQRVTVFAQHGGAWPPVIYPHAKLPVDHVDVPSPLHRYLLGDAPGVGLLGEEAPERVLTYWHADDCGPCRPRVDAQEHRG
jgi:hypothetical protein